MGIVCVDFESLYSVEYSLSHMSVEKYIRDARFEVIGCGISINGRPSIWYPQPEVKSALDAIDWSSTALLAFNTAFDGAILGWVFGHYPALYLDAMGMARACGKSYKGGSLAKVSETMGLGQKGTYVVQAKGKRYADFLPHELAQYGEYCNQDVDLTVAMYKALKPEFPSSEAQLQDLNLRLFIEPLLSFDTEALRAYHTEVVEDKQAKRMAAAKMLSLEWVNPDELDATLATTLSSNPQFAQVLKDLGVEPPTKLSPTTGKETYAFAKTDPEFMELLEHEDTAVQVVVAARLGTKSTIEETRAESFLDIATRGAWPVQYNYYGANTSRFSGGGNANPQNLKRGGRLRSAILPPPGHLLVAADLGQIECRVLNYLAMQDDVVEAFRLHDEGAGPDVYCILAEKIYRKPVVPGDKERLVGKIGELQSGYGSSGRALKKMLFTQAKISMPVHQAQSIIDVYRGSHKQVVNLWDQGDAALGSMLRGQQFSIGRPGMVEGAASGIKLPNGLYLRYPELRQKADDKGRIQFCYTKQNKPVFTHGAVIVQNLCEALSRLILTDAWLRLSKRVRVVLQTHDELVAVVPFAEVDRALEIMVEEMTQPVPWAPGLPLACEAKAGATYGQAKG